jgi:hypothetical protein
MTNGLMYVFFNTPVLHYSKADTFNNFWPPLNCLFIGYNSEKELSSEEKKCRI